MSTIAHAAYHCTYNLTGEHAVAMDAGEGVVAAHLESGDIRFCTLADVTLCGPAEAPLPAVPPHTPEAAATVEFDQALLHAASRAKAAYPAERRRIERGLQIALSDGVTLLADGTAVVQSQSQADVTYRVNGVCHCVDAAYAPEGRCKHRWGKSLVKWVLKAERALPPVARCGICFLVLEEGTVTCALCR